MTTAYKRPMSPEQRQSQHAQNSVSPDNNEITDRVPSKFMPSGFAQPFEIGGIKSFRLAILLEDKSNELGFYLRDIDASEPWEPETEEEKVQLMWNSRLRLAHRVADELARAFQRAYESGFVEASFVEAVEQEIEPIIFSDDEEVRELWRQRLHTYYNVGRDELNTLK